MTKTDFEHLVTERVNQVCFSTISTDEAIEDIMAGLEQLEVNKCVIPVVMESDTEKYKTCTATECHYKGQCEDCGHYRYVSVP